MAVHPLGLVRLVLVDLRQAAVAVLDVDTDARAALGLGFHQHLDAVVALMLQLQLLERVHEIVGERRVVGGLLPDLLPTHGRRSRWGDEEVLLELWWAKEVTVSQLVEGSGVSPVDTQECRGANKDPLASHTAARKEANVPEVSGIDEETVTTLFREFSGLFIVVDDDCSRKRLERCPGVDFTEGLKMRSQRVKYDLFKEWRWHRREDQSIRPCRISVSKRGWVELWGATGERVA